MNNNQTEMNILFCCDTNYAMPLTVSVASIFENNKEYRINIYIFYSSLTDLQQKKLIELSNLYNQKINFVKVDTEYFKSAPVFRWSKETYYRLLLVDLLPNTVEKVLYLDCDIIVDKPLDDLFNIDFETYSILALEETNFLSPRKRLGLESQGKYFQAGVLLFNIDKCKGILNYENSLNIINNLGSKLEVVDQDVINVMFDGKIKSIDRKFNNCEITNFNGNNSNRFFNHTDQSLIDETIVFHYATGKPWNKIYSGSCENIWYKYLRLSPYSFLYDSKYNTLKYRLLRSGISKVLFYEYIHITPYINKISSKLLSPKTYSTLKNWYRKNIK